MQIASRKVIAGLMVSALCITTLSSAGSDVEAKAKASLKTKKISVKVGKKKSILIKNKTKKHSYSFTSSNKQVAKVTSKGKVTGIKAGKATITVKEVLKKGKKKKRKLGKVKVTVPCCCTAPWCTATKTGMTTSSCACATSVSSPWATISRSASRASPRIPPPPCPPPPGRIWRTGLPGKSRAATGRPPWPVWTISLKSWCWWRAETSTASSSISSSCTSPWPVCPPSGAPPCATSSGWISSSSTPLTSSTPWTAWPSGAGSWWPTLWMISLPTCLRCPQRPPGPCPTSTPTIWTS